MTGDEETPLALVKRASTTIEECLETLAWMSILNKSAANMNSDLREENDSLLEEIERLQEVNKQELQALLRENTSLRNENAQLQISIARAHKEEVTR